jgi:biotin transport system substrate-specific component
MTSMVSDIRAAAGVWTTGRRGVAGSILLALAGSSALWISAKIAVPFYPVPMTMQSLVVLLIGTAYGWRLGVATLALYLVEGATGLPVFAGTPERGLGLAYMAGPTAGYLLGYVLAAALCGWCADRGWTRGLARTAAAILAATLVIDLAGFAWLGLSLGWDKPVFTWGLLPFLPGDLTKAALAVALVTAGRRMMEQPR